MRALATGIEKDAAAYGAGPPGARGQTSSTGGVSRFLLPTFLCGGKEK